MPIETRIAELSRVSHRRRHEVPPSDHGVGN